MSDGARSEVPDRPTLLELDPRQTEERLVALGGRPFHARVARRAVLEQGHTDWSRMTSLPAALRERLEVELPVLAGRELERREAPDGTVKLLIALPRGAAIEAVWIPSRRPGRGATLCVSTQVGCPVACPFCASGRAGLERNLARAEILEQYVRGRAVGALSRSVVMGIGEPLLNLENLLAALDVVRGEMGLGARRITVSTVGFPERLAKLAPRRPGFQLAISLHTPDDAQRDRLVPAMAGVPIERVLEAGDRWFEETGREVTYEYVLLGGFNDSSGHAERLARRLAGRRATVNLIPYNPIDEPSIGGNPIDDESYTRPGPDAVETFRSTLEQAGVVATVRISRGLESAAACGQLRLHPGHPGHPSQPGHRGPAGAGR